MSENRLDRVVLALSFHNSEMIRTYYERPLRSATELSAELNAYLAELESQNSANEFIDMQTARRLGAQCHALLDGNFQQASEDIRRLIQTAIAYFIENDDAEDDTQSPIGFDDDAEVIEAIAREIGREDVLEITGEDF